MAPPPIRLMLADVDGTLVTQDKVLTDRAIAAVAKLKQAGHSVRDHQRPPAARHVDAHRAARSHHADRGLQRRGVRPSRHVGDRATDHTRRPDAGGDRGARRAMGQTCGSTGARTGSCGTCTAPHVDREAWTVKFDPTLVESFASVPDGVAKVVGVSDDYDTVQKAVDAVRERFGDHVSAARSQPYYADVTHPDANKGAVVGVPLQDLPDPRRSRSPRSATSPTTCSCSPTPGSASPWATPATRCRPLLAASPPPTRTRASPTRSSGSSCPDPTRTLPERVGPGPEPNGPGLRVWAQRGSCLRVNIYWAD